MVAAWRRPRTFPCTDFVKWNSGHYTCNSFTETKTLCDAAIGSKAFTNGKTAKEHAAHVVAAILKN